MAGMRSAIKEDRFLDFRRTFYEQRTQLFEEH
jgi:queuine/archaeosine tRNA-ribosyltransferase